MNCNDERWARLWGTFTETIFKRNYIKRNCLHFFFLFDEWYNAHVKTSLTSWGETPSPMFLKPLAFCYKPLLERFFLHCVASLFLPWFGRCFTYVPTVDRPFFWKPTYKLPWQNNWEIKPFIGSMNSCKRKKRDRLVPVFKEEKAHPFCSPTSSTQHLLDVSAKKNKKNSFHTQL